MGNGPDRLFMPQTGYRAAIDDLEDCSLGFHGGVGRLIENAPHVAVALWRAVAVIRACALVVAGACTNPGGETFLGRKGRCGGTDFGNDLLRGIDTQTRYLRQSLDCILVLVARSPLPARRNYVL